MKKQLITAGLSLLFFNLSAQEKVQDSTKVQILEEVLVQSITLEISDKQFEIIRFDIKSDDQVR